jgi:adenine phosphoribosyltransferase
LNLAISIIKTTIEMATVYVASEAPIKVEACKGEFYNVIPVKVNSGVNEQPINYKETRLGAYNRNLAVKGVLPVISFESGIVLELDGYYDVTICVFRDRFGTVDHSVKKKIYNLELLQKWLDLPNKHEVTLGSLYAEAYQCDKADWYLQDAGDRTYSRSRKVLMQIAVNTVINKYNNTYNGMSSDVAAAPLVQFNNVQFLDIQYALLHYTYLLFHNVVKLTTNLDFNKVVVMDARGFLFAGLFPRKNIVLARKPGKLPSNVVTIEYDKEYGKDSISIETTTIVVGDKVIILDDVIATGNTMRAAASLVTQLGGQVAACIAPYAIQAENGTYMCGEFLEHCRFIWTQREAHSAYEEEHK